MPRIKAIGILRTVVRIPHNHLRGTEQLRCTASDRDVAYYPSMYVLPPIRDTTCTTPPPMSLDDLSLGNELKDGFKTTQKWIQNGIDWLADIDDFYKERATIEREYSARLRELCQKHFDKKAKNSLHLSVGDEPQITPGSLEAASVVLWNDVLTQTEAISKERDNFASQLQSKVGLNLNTLQAKLDKIARHIAGINEFLISEKKASEEDVNKAKKAYDGLCQKTEAARQKTEKSASEKYQQKLREKEVDMNIGKNHYLMRISVANRLKDKYFFQDLPEVLDYFQELNESRVAILNKLIKNANIIERNSNDKVKELLFAVDETIEQNNPKLDTAMFVKHNTADWTEPTDFYFTPCDFWHDDELLVTSEPELTDLKKQLSTSLNAYARSKELTLGAKQKLEEVSASRKASQDSTTLKFDTKLFDALCLLQKFMKEDSARVRSEVEIEIIQNFAGGKDLSYHEARQEKKSRFGLFKSSKPATLEVSDTHSVHTATSEVTTHSGGLGGIFSLRRSNTTSTSKHTPSAKAIYAYDATGDDEISVTQGEELEVVEADDGSGWTMVLTSGGARGLVPTSYIEVFTEKKKGPSVAPRRGAKRVRYVEAMYDYNAEEPNELTIRVGDKISVIKDDADGWTEGEINGQKGLFPTAYAKAV